MKKVIHDNDGCKLIGDVIGGVIELTQYLDGNEVSRLNLNKAEAKELKKFIDQIVSQYKDTTF